MDPVDQSLCTWRSHGDTAFAAPLFDGFMLRIVPGQNAGE